MRKNTLIQLAVLLLTVFGSHAKADAQSNWSCEWHWLSWFVQGPSCCKPVPWWKYLPDDREYRALIPAFNKVHVRKDQIVPSPFGGYIYFADSGLQYKINQYFEDYDGYYVILIPRFCCG